jgi:hypothetical protein
MAWAASTVIGLASAGASVVGGLMSGDASSQASGQQIAATQAGIDAQNKNFDYIKGILSPFVDTGTKANTGQADLTGLNGNNSQQTAIDAIKNSPYFGTLKAQGEDSILQNASATGGLRGGNTQLALSQFSPNLLQQLIQQQFSNLGGLTSNGLNATTTLGNASTNSANNVSNLYSQQGGYQAGNTIAQGNINNGMINGVLQGFGTAYGGWNNGSSGGGVNNGGSNNGAGINFSNYASPF